jgi:hypothetical protein
MGMYPGGSWWGFVNPGVGQSLSRGEAILAATGLSTESRSNGGLIFPAGLLFAAVFCQFA